MTLTINRIDPQPIQAWCVSLETAGDVVAALNTIKPLGWSGQINSSNWSIVLTRAGTKDSFTAGNGSWIVFDGIHVDLLTNDQLISTYTDNVPLVWPATTTAPVLVPIAGQQATLTCPAPTSVNGPWTYSVSLTDSTAQSTSEFTSPPTVANGVLTWTISDLVVGDEYTAQITCNTQYGGAGVNSLPTASVTAVA